MVRGAISSIAAVLVLSAATVAQQATSLKLHVPLERSLAPGARDAYEIELRDGECATITVDQVGVDLVIRTADASDAVVAEIDDEPRTEGRERFTLVGDQTGAA